jgi:hypothetical protein
MLAHLTNVCGTKLTCQLQRHRMELFVVTNAIANLLAADYESGGQEFESLRARQHLAPTFRAKNTAILRNLQGTELAPILRLMRSCIGRRLASGHRDGGDRHRPCAAECIRSAKAGNIRVVFCSAPREDPDIQWTVMLFFMAPRSVPTPSRVAARVARLVSTARLRRGNRSRPCIPPIPRRADGRGF